MRIAAFASGEAGSTHYRAYKPMLALVRRGHEAWVNNQDDLLPPDVARYDVAYIQRYQDPKAQRMVRRLREAGLAIVWDHDDAVDQTSDQKVGALKQQEAVAGIRAMVALADVVTTTSPVLADRYRELGAEHVHVVENFLPDEFADVTRRPHDGLVLGWPAWRDHQADWNALGLPRGDRYTRIPPKVFDELPEEIARFDIGIAPIVDEPFNRSRSNVKVKEYAALGIPWVASPIGPYADLGEKQGGLLAADDRWYEQLDRVIGSARLRRKLAKQGRKWGAKQLMRDNAGRWEAAFGEAIERARAGRSGAAAVA
jgi:Glycosyl transferases group 1